LLGQEFQNEEFPMRVSDFGNINDNHNWELILSLWEEFDSSSLVKSHLNLKDRAAEYLDIEDGNKLNRSELKLLIAKAHKLKISTKKEERARGVRLAKQIERVFNFYK
jgi:hypothetical protein